MNVMTVLDRMNSWLCLKYTKLNFLCCRYIC